MFVAADFCEQFLEGLSRQTERTNIVADDILTQISVHFYNDRTRDSWLCHDEVIAFDT